GGLERGLGGDEADGGALGVDGNEPEPAVGQAHDDGVAGGGSVWPGNAGEVVVDGEALGKGGGFEGGLELAGEELVAAAGVDHVTGEEGGGGSAGGREGDGVAVGGRVDGGDGGLGADLDAGLAGLVEDE